MKIELPLETWIEVLGFVPRSQLVLLVPHTGEKKPKRNRRRRKCKQSIGDRQFVSFVQFFLHKCGEVVLGRLHICPSDDGNEPIVTAKEENRELPLADVPIPENVKNFQSIRISNFDESVIVFLQKFEQNTLLTNVNLYFHDCQDFLIQIMTLPLFTTINSIAISNLDVLDQIQCEYSELAIPMLTSARVLLADYNCHNVWFCDWLHIPREDGKPRVLCLCGYNEDGRTFSHSHFIKHIKKNFLEASQAVSFFIKLKRFRDDTSVQSVTLENGQTKEKLVIKGANENYDLVTISRCPMATNEEWIEEMSKRPNFDNRAIEFDT